MAANADVNLSLKHFLGTATNQSAGRHPNLINFSLSALPNVMGTSTKEGFGQ